MCTLQLPKCFLLVQPCSSRPSSVSLPPTKASADLPSNSTTAPSGGLAFSVGLARWTLSNRPSSVPPLSVITATPSLILASASSPLNTADPSFSSPSASCLVSLSQPSPGKPP